MRGFFRDLPFLPLIWIGGVAALIVGLVTRSAPLFWITIAPFALIGMLWRRNEPPFLAFALGFQWVAISVGYVFKEVAGYWVGYVMPGDWDKAVVLSILGLLALAAGIQIIAYRPSQSEEDLTEYSPARLFLLVVALYSLDYVVMISRFIFSVGAAQIFVNVLFFRDVFLFLLLWQTLRTFRGLSYAMAGAVFVLIPQFASAMSQFKSVLFMFVVAAAGLVTSTTVSRTIRRRLFTWGVLVAVMTFGAGLFWEGAFKPIWRPAAMADSIGHTPFERIDSFVSYLGDATSDLDLTTAVEGLTSRLAGASIYFSNVLVRVPALIDYEHGTLTQRAIMHLLIPRLFDPDKEVLGSDSWLVVYYAGVAVAGEDQDTSVGLGYMAELFIDWGAWGMPLAVMVLGMIFGGTVVALKRFAPSQAFFVASATVLYLRQLPSYEERLPKLLGGTVQNAIVFCALMFMFGPALHRFLSQSTKQWEPVVPEPSMHAPLSG